MYQVSLGNPLQYVHMYILYITVDSACLDSAIDDASPSCECDDVKENIRQYIHSC